MNQLSGSRVREVPGWLHSVVVALCSLALACSSSRDSSGGGATGSAGASQANGEPTIPVEGYKEDVSIGPKAALWIEPVVLSLAPLESAVVHGRVLGVAGQFEDAASLTLSSSDEKIATTSGNTVVAVSEGMVTLRVRAPDVADASVTLIVTRAEQPAVLSVSFDPPLLALDEGASGTVKIHAWDRKGNEVSSAGISLASSPGAPFTLDGTTVRATRAGTGQVEPSLGGAFLPAPLPVFVRKVPTPAAAGACQTNVDTYDGCAVAEAPTLFARPGLSSPVRVFAFHTLIPSTCDTKWKPYVELVSPDTVLVSNSTIVKGGTGSLTAQYPGDTPYLVKHKGQVCGHYHVGVLLDVQGPWAMTCKNGDSGTLNVSTTYPDRNAVFRVQHQSPADGEGAATQGVFARAYGATSCTKRKKDGSTCEGPAEVKFLLPHTVTVSDCASADHFPSGTPISSNVTSTAAFTVGDCSFARGTTGCSPTPVSGGSFSLDGANYELEPSSSTGSYPAVGGVLDLMFFVKGPAGAGTPHAISLRIPKYTGPGTYKGTSGSVTEHVGGTLCVLDDVEGYVIFPGDTPVPGLPAGYWLGAQGSSNTKYDTDDPSLGGTRSNDVVVTVTEAPVDATHVHLTLKFSYSVFWNDCAKFPATPVGHVSNGTYELTMFRP